MKLHKIENWQIVLLGLALTLLIQCSKYINNNKVCKNKHSIHQQK